MKECTNSKYLIIHKENDMSQMWPCLGIWGEMQLGHQTFYILQYDNKPNPNFPLNIPYQKIGWTSSYIIH